jgi:ubiquinone/menaquinone biosynthesis C-methylase UbiE
MRFYHAWILPRLLHTAMRQEMFAPFRQRVAARAEGRVLEIGIGSGLNFPFYSDRVTSVVGLEPSRPLLEMARRARHHVPRVRLIEGSAERIPLQDRSVDTVVSTWTLCSIPDVAQALREMRRVLVPSGRLLFAEHGRTSDARVNWWQDRLTPIWRRVAGGCHLNRDMRQLVEDAGFQIEQIDRAYLPGPKPWTFMSEGSGIGSR